MVKKKVHEVDWARLIDLLIEDRNADAIFEKEITAWGTSAHVAIPKTYLGQKAKVIIKKKEKKDKSK